MPNSSFICFNQSFRSVFNFIKLDQEKGVNSAASVNNFECPTDPLIFCKQLNLCFFYSCLSTHEGGSTSGREAQPGNVPEPPLPRPGCNAPRPPSLQHHPPRTGRAPGAAAVPFSPGGTRGKTRCVQPAPAPRPLRHSPAPGLPSGRGAGPAPLCGKSTQLEPEPARRPGPAAPAPPAATW